jgi:AAA domain
MKPAHFLGIRGASLLRTPAWALGREGLLEATQQRAITAVTGPPGTGKTFLLNTVEPELNLPVVRIEPHLRPSMLSITTQLLEVLTGDPGKGSRHAKIRPLVDALASPVVVMVDEAQRMNRECLDHLRYLHDHRDTDFALVLAGGQGCWEVLGREPQLKRRIWRPTFFGPLAPPEVMVLMPMFHPVWQTDAEVIETLNAEFAHGVLGNWAALTATATLSRVDAAAPVEVGDVAGILLRHGIQSGVRC